MNSKQPVSNLATAGVQGLVPYQPGKPISELQRELGLEYIVKLASNENPLGPSPKAIAAVQSVLPEAARYPDGNGFDLKNALADHLAVNGTQITLGNGSNEILELAARTFLTVESEVIFSEHAFAVYPLVTQAVGATSRVVPAANYAHDLNAMLDFVTDKTRMVFIANPNNPTGTYIKQSDLGTFISSLPEHVICVLDEAYFEYVGQADYADSIAWLNQYANLLITRTFSKAYGLAGLRIGYSISSAEIADLLNRVRQPFNNNMLALVAAEAALHDQDHLQRSITVNCNGLCQLTRAFTELNFPWIPSAANFVTVDMQQEALPIYQDLLQKGVIVRPIANYGLPNHLRISIGTEAENQFFIETLISVLQDV